MSLRRSVNARKTLLQRAVAKGRSVCPSVRHIREPRLHGLSYRNTFCTLRSSDVFSFFDT